MRPSRLLKRIISWTGICLFSSRVATANRQKEASEPVIQAKDLSAACCMLSGELPGVHFRKAGNHLLDPGAVTPFIVIPAHNLDEVPVQHLG